MSGILLDEYELLGDARYRSYISAVDKALKHFEYTSEWADLISALGKLNKVLLSNVKYPVIPRRIIISKRLAQCMHPVLPSGVHLKALETYDIIFKCIGSNRLSQELFIYSAGLFPLLGNAAMNVKPSLLTIYETHFVPLGEKLRPGLNGFLIGVLPGLEEGSDYYERTDQLLQTVCNNVEKSFFYGCLWKCILSNATIRLPAVTFIIDHFNRKLSMEDQLHVIGTDIDTMVQGLCASLQDSSVLVQRCALDLLLLGFPIHSNQLVASDMVQVVTSASTVVLKRDMSLNRRLFSWLMGGDALGPEEVKKSTHGNVYEKIDGNSYFRQYSKDYLLKALQFCFDNPQAVMSSASVNADLWCYRLLISLLDRPEISSVILDDILIDIFRSLFLACNSPNVCNYTEKRSQKSNKDQNELKKAANLLFGTLEPSYLWEYSAKYFEIACHSSVFLDQNERFSSLEYESVHRVGSGNPSLSELCALVGFLLDVVSLETYLEAKTEHLPKLLCNIFDVLTYNCIKISVREISLTLKLCSKLLCKIQPPLINFESGKFISDISSCTQTEELPCSNRPYLDNKVNLTHEQLSFTNLNQGIEQILHCKDSDLKVILPCNNGVRSIITSCEEKFQNFVVTFIKEKMISDFEKSLLYYESLILPKEGGKPQREKQLDTILRKCLILKNQSRTTDDVVSFKKDIKDLQLQKNYLLNQVENVVPNNVLCEAFEQLSHLLKELSSFPTFYTNSKDLYDKHMRAVRPSVIPDWLKLLISLVCFVSSDDIFFPATSALFDLITLTKSALHNNEINEVASVSPTSAGGAQSNSTTVVLVALTPAVSSSQLEFLSTETLLFDVAAQKLWKYVGDDKSTYCSYGTELLQEVHNLSPVNSVCETIICKSMSSKNEMVI